MFMNILCLWCCNEAAGQSRAAEAHICKGNTETDHVSADSWVHRKANNFGIPFYLMADELWLIGDLKMRS